MKTIKELRKKLLEIIQANNPDYYIMKKQQFDDLVKRFEYLESELIRLKQSRDDWKNKLKLKK